MLTLSRKSNETIRIGNDICITIKRIDGDVVKVGIEAPLDVVIYRGEVYEKMKALNLQASVKNPGDKESRNVQKLLSKMLRVSDGTPPSPPAP